MQNATDATTIMAVAPRFRVAGVVRVIAATFAVAACTLSPAGITAPRPTANDPFLDTVQARTFRWFWDLTPPSTGLTPDRWPTRTFSSIAAIGFALPSYVVGAERKYVTRAQASERVLNTLRFLYRLPQGDAPSGVAGHKGFFYHFLNLETGLRFETVELSTIDTALLLAGVMVC